MQDCLSPVLRKAPLEMPKHLRNRTDAMKGKNLVPLFCASSQDSFEYPFLFGEAFVKPRPCIESHFADIARIGKIAFKESKFSSTLSYKLRV